MGKEKDVMLRKVAGIANMAHWPMLRNCPLCTTIVLMGNPQMSNVQIWSIYGQLNDYFIQ